MSNLPSHHRNDAAEPALDGSNATSGGNDGGITRGRGEPNATAQTSPSPSSTVDNTPSGGSDRPSSSIPGTSDHETPSQSNNPLNNETSDMNSSSINATSPSVTSPSITNTTNTNLNSTIPINTDNLTNLNEDTTGSLEDNLRNFFRDELTRANDTRQESASIVISINYVFSDENNPTNPNRTGILTLTLPNSASNRDPRVLQEFIRLATQMAYATIINSSHNKGVSIDKFNSFKHLTPQEIIEQQCSICLEDFVSDATTIDSVNSKINDEVNLPKKKRKLNDSSSINSNNIESTDPESTSDNNHGDTNINEERKKYLSELTTEFPHVPIQMPCNHIFGKSCLCEWLKTHSTCPLCRKAIDEPDSEANGGNANPNENVFRFDGQNTFNPDGSNVIAITGQEFQNIFNQFRRDHNGDINNTTGTPNNINNNSDTHNDTNNETNNVNHNNSDTNNDTNNSSNTSTDTTENGNGTSTIVSIGRRMIRRPSNILSYIRRRSNNNMFASGVESRRTSSGVVTRDITNDAPPPVIGSRLHRVYPQRDRSASPSTNANNEPRDANENINASDDTNNNGRVNTNNRPSITDEILDYLNLRNLSDRD